MSNTHDVIAAFADGELVDPAQLGGALADEAGREHLVDLLVLRGLMGGSPGARPAVGASPSSTHRARRWLAIAALLAVAVAGGFFAGQRRVPSAAVSAGQSSGAPATSVTAPSPTRVIRLENGVDWNERAGGN
jgi:hypothetical protein